MSKPIKNMMTEDYKAEFDGLEGALVLEIRGIGANDNNRLRTGLRSKNIRITVVKNTLARKAIAGTKLEPLTEALAGPSALAYGADSVVDVAREIVDWAKKVEKLALKAAVLDGILFEGAEGVKKLSKFPTKGEAQATVVQLFLSPASNLARAATSPGSNIAGILKALKEKLEKGEAVARIA